MKTYVSAKLHGLVVTDKSVEYHGSVTIGADLLAAAGIEEYEQVHVVNLTNGHRWVTYAVPGPDGVFTLNGGGARLGEKGDKCVVMAYDVSEYYEPATVVHVDANNVPKDKFKYKQQPRPLPPPAQ